MEIIKLFLIFILSGCASDQLDVCLRQCPLKEFTYQQRYCDFVCHYNEARQERQKDVEACMAKCPKIVHKDGEPYQFDYCEFRCKN